jgi:hypothetical protein
MSSTCTNALSGTALASPPVRKVPSGSCSRIRCSTRPVSGRSYRTTVLGRSSSGVTGRIMTTSPGVTRGSIEPDVTRVGDQPRNPQGRKIHSDRLLAIEMISMLIVPAP